MRVALPGTEGEGPSWLSFSARRPDHPLQELVNWDDAAFLTLDGTRYERVRLRALDCHHTQLGLFSKFAHGTMPTSSASPPSRPTPFSAGPGTTDPGSG